MKKIVKVSLLLTAVASLGMMSASAKPMTETDLNDLVTLGSQAIPENLYIYGKYVFANTISSSDLQIAADDMYDDAEYAKEYRKLFDDGIASLIHKNSNNVWKNLRSNKSLAKSVSIEMTHLVGDLKGTHLSNKDIYDGSYVKRENYGDRIAEIFVDTSIDLRVESISKISKIADLGSSIGNDTHKYNTSAIDVAYDKEVATITENSPLLAFRYKNGVDSGSWIALLVKANRPVTKKDTVTLTGAAYAVELDSTKHGGASNEFILWVNTDEVDSKEKLTLTIKDESATEAQKITIEYPQNITPLLVTKEIMVKDDDTTVTIDKTNKAVENVVAVPVEIDGKYSIIFYEKNGDSVTTSFNFNVGELKYQAKYSSEYEEEAYYQVIDKYSFTVAEAGTSEDSKWNQAAVSEIELVKTENKKDGDPDYTVKIHINKGLKGSTSTKNVKLDINLIGTTNSETIALSGVTKTYSNESSISGNTLIIKYEIVDDTKALEASFTKSESKEIYSDIVAEPDHAKYNRQYLNNLDYTSDLITEFDEESKTYTITIKQLEKEKELTEVTGAKVDKITIPNMYIGVIVDFGIAYEDLTITPSTLVSNYKVSGNAMAKKLGATSDTAFVVWVDQLNTDIVVKVNDSKNTNTTMTLVFNLKGISGTYLDKNDVGATNTVKISEEYVNDVEYIKGKGFILSEAIAKPNQKFVATVTTTVDGKSVETEYTYIYKTDAIDTDKDGLVKIQNLKVNGVIPTIHADGGYATDAIDYVKFDDSTNTINVVFKKNPGKTSYGLVIDLGLGSEKSTGSQIKKNGAAAENISPSGHLSTEDAAKIKNYTVIWVNPETSADAGQQFALTHVKDGNESMSLNITVKSTVVAEPYFDEEELDSNEFVVDPNKPLDKGEKPEDFQNQDKITTSIKDGKVYITYSDELAEYTNKQGKQKWFAILFDLGVDPTKLTAQSVDGYVEYGINEEDVDAEQVARFGGSGTQFVLWLCEKAFELDETTGLMTYKIKFAPTKDEEDQYADPIEVTFILVDNVDRLTVKASNLSERSDSATALKWSYDQGKYELNQKRLTYEFKDKSDGKTKAAEINIKAAKNTELPVEYALSSSERIGKWYAINFDLGKEVKVTGQTVGVWYPEEIDYSKGQFILWVNTDSEDLSSKEMTITDVNNKTYEKITINFQN